MSVKIKLVEFTIVLGWTLFRGIKRTTSCLSVWCSRGKAIIFEETLWTTSILVGKPKVEGVEIFSDDGACWWASTQITASGTGNRQLEACTEMKRASKRGGRFLGSRLEAWLLILLPGQVSFELKGSVNKVDVPAQSKEDSAWLLAWSDWVIPWTHSVGLGKQCRASGC